MDILLKIKDILSAHYGKANCITSREIASLIGIHEDDTHAQTRNLIFKCATQYSLPLAADNQGYYLINSTDEYDSYMKNLDSRIGGIENRKEIITKNFKGRNQ